MGDGVYGQRLFPTKDTCYQPMKSQTSKVLARLKRGGWVSMPALWRASGAFAVHSRIADLRKAGHEIVNRIERGYGCRKSFYKLEV